jgi:hypothetical protein
MLTLFAYFLLDYLVCFIRILNTLNIKIIYVVGVVSMKNNKKKIIGCAEYKKMIKISERVQSQFEQMNKLMAIKISQNVFSDFSKQIEIATQGIMRVKRKHNKIKKSRNKWILHKNMPISIISLYDENKHEFEDFVDNDKAIKGLINFYRKNKYFKKHLEILEEGLKAHKNKNYIVSIPLFLLSIDGILIHYGIKNKFVKDGKIMTNEKRNPLANMKSVSNYLKNMLSNDFINFMSRKPKTKRARSNYLWNYRNNVMHGTDTKYASLQWSLKLLIVLRILDEMLK